MKEKVIKTSYSSEFRQKAKPGEDLNSDPEDSDMEGKSLMEAIKQRLEKKMRDNNRNYGEGSKGRKPSSIEQGIILWIDRRWREESEEGRRKESRRGEMTDIYGQYTEMSVILKPDSMLDLQPLFISTLNTNIYTNTLYMF